MNTLVFLLVALISVAEASKCSVQTSEGCGACVSTTAWGLPCRWCPRDSQCHDPGAIGMNPCAKEENIVTLSTCKCADLYAQIIERRNELARRVYELLKDEGELPLKKPEKPDPRYGFRSIAGEIIQFEGKQVNLRKLLNDHLAAGCQQKTDDAWRFATREVPKEIPNTDSSTASKVALALEVSAVTVLAVFAAPEIVASGALALLLNRLATQ